MTALIIGYVITLIIINLSLYITLREKVYHRYFKEGIIDLSKYNLLYGSFLFYNTLLILPLDYLNSDNITYFILFYIGTELVRSYLVKQLENGDLYTPDAYKEDIVRVLNFIFLGGVIHSILYAITILLQVISP